jgi:hypothetical protein
LLSPEATPAKCVFYIKRKFLLIIDSALASGMEIQGAVSEKALLQLKSGPERLKTGAA